MTQRPGTLGEWSRAVWEASGGDNEPTSVSATASKPPLGVGELIKPQAGPFHWVQARESFSTHLSLGEEIPEAGMF